MTASLSAEYDYDHQCRALLCAIVKDGLDSLETLASGRLPMSVYAGQAGRRLDATAGDISRYIRREIDWATIAADDSGSLSLSNLCEALALPNRVRERGIALADEVMRSFPSVTPPGCTLAAWPTNIKPAQQPKHPAKIKSDIVPAATRGSGRGI